MSQSENKNKEISVEESIEKVASLPKSDSKNVRLVKYEPEYFAGITPETGIVINFDEMPDGHNMIGITGDQGLGKTSLMNGLISLMGGELPKNAINSDTGNLREELVFTKPGEENVSWVVKRTKTAITVTRVEQLPDGGFSSSIQKSPMTFLQDTFGSVGISPMVLKTMKGKEQITWLRNHQKLSSELKKKEDTLKYELGVVYHKRTEKNKEVKEVFKKLTVSPYYSFNSSDDVWKETSKYITDTEYVKGKPDDITDVRQRFDDCNSKKNLFDNSKNEVERLEGDLTEINNQIENLKKQLAAAEQRKAEHEERISKGKKWIEDNATVYEEFEQANKDLLDFNNVADLRRTLKDVDALVSEYNTLTDEQVLLDSEVEERRTELKEFIAEISPKIDGLEIVVASGIDNDKEEGIYYQGRTMLELSESELWQFFVQLCTSMGIYFVFIENSQSLGSQAVNIINMLSQQKGVTVFFTTMVRGQNKISIHMHDRLK